MKNVFVFMILATLARAADWVPTRLVEVHNSDAERSLRYTVAHGDSATLYGHLAPGATRRLEVENPQSVTLSVFAVPPNPDYAVTVGLTDGGGNYRVDYWFEPTFGVQYFRSELHAAYPGVPVFVHGWAFIAGVVAAVPFVLWNWTRRTMEETL